MQRPRILITRRLPEAVHERLRDRYDLTANIADEPLDPSGQRAVVAIFLWWGTSYFRRTERSFADLI